MKILVLNSGSSSQKSRLYELGGALPESPAEPLWEGGVAWDGGEATLTTQTGKNAPYRVGLGRKSRADATNQLLDSLESNSDESVCSLDEIDVVGHRIVNGGHNYWEPSFVTEDVKQAIEATAVLAPLHNRAELEGIEMAQQRCPGAKQVAVFDTGFHSTLAEEVFTYAGPYEWREKGIRKFGFHGINHHYCSERAAVLVGKNPTELKIVSCHLGNGCSLAAVAGGKSVETTMGFTPLDGLMMGTRSGSVDPGVLTYLLQQGGTDATELNAVLNEKSGLLGIFGASGDMRQVTSAMLQGNARAKLAFEMFVHRLRLGIGAMTAALGGLDVLVFTGGIGENSCEVRSATCDGLEYLGVHIEKGKNASGPAERELSAAGSKVRVLVIPAQEDWMIATSCWNLLKKC